LPLINGQHTFACAGWRHALEIGLIALFKYVGWRHALEISRKQSSFFKLIAYKLLIVLNIRKICIITIIK